MIKESTSYLFTSERLGFRNWLAGDLEVMAELNADPKVMEFFPLVKSKQETQEFIERMQKHFSEKGFCYFAADTLHDKECIGFIGLMEQNYEVEFSPFIDIGWRLKTGAWGKGYATEGAKRCLRFGFEGIKLPKICSVAPEVNVKSEQVMKKIGMKKVKTFDHPLLKNDPRLKKCVLYEQVNPLLS